MVDHDEELDRDDDPEALDDLRRVVHDEPSPEEAALHIEPADSPPEAGLDEIEEIMEAIAVED